MNTNYPTKARSVSTTGICYQNNFYEIDSNNGKNVPINHLEKAWGVFENHWKSLVGIIETQPASMTDDLASKLIISSISLKLRNPSIRSKYQGPEAQEIAENNIQQVVKDFEGLSPIYVSQIETHLRNGISMEGGTGKNLHNELLLSIVEDRDDSLSYKICERLSKHHIRILKTTDDKPFITTDNPGFCFDGEGRVHNLKYFGDGNQVDFGGFCLPLTPKLCLFIMSNRMIGDSCTTRPISYTTLEPSGVSEINFHSIRLSCESIFCNDKLLLESCVTEYFEKKRVKEKVVRV